MARILYGVCGQGSGHAMRAKEVLAYLTKAGHEVQLATSGAGERYLAADYPTTVIAGLHLHYQDNGVKYTRTVVENMLKMPEFVRSRERLSSLVAEFHPAVVITDFEPLTALAAHRHDLPLLSIDNQHFLTNTDIKYPARFTGSATSTAAITRLVINRADQYLVTSFIDAPVKNERTIIIPPILRQQILAAQPTTGDYFLVYLTSIFADISPVLAGLPHRFIVYGLNRDETIGNVTYKPAGEETFIADLIGCRAIIATSGFTLLTEALYLGKPYLALPVAKQFEQTLNAYLLEQAGYGLMAEKLTPDMIAAFVSRLPEFTANLADYPRTDNQPTFDAIDRFITDHAAA